MKVSRLEAADLPTHTAAWINRTTLLGSVEFARLWETMGGRVVYWVANEGDRIIALLPGVEFGSGWLTRYQAMPDGLYGQLLFPEGVAKPNVLADALVKGIAARRYAKVFLTDYYSHLRPTGAYVVRLDQTLAVDISAPDWQPPDKKLQSEIRKAEREDIRLQEFSLNRHFDGFIELMKLTERRHGRRPKYPTAFWRALGKLAMTDARVKWLVCEHEERMAASHIYLVESEMALNWQIYFDKGFSFLKPNQFIMFSVARDLARHGVISLTLGATPGDADSLANYKKKWGGRTVEYACLYRYSWLGRFL